MCALAIYKWFTTKIRYNRSHANIARKNVGPGFHLRGRNGLYVAFASGKPLTGSSAFTYLTETELLKTSLSAKAKYDRQIKGDEIRGEEGERVLI